MPTRLIDYIEGEVSNQLNADDTLFSFSESMTDIKVQTVDATGEIVISAVGNSNVSYFSFDPTGTLSSSSQSATTGALTYIGTEGQDSTQTYATDTSGLNYWGVGSNPEAYEILPDGNVLVAADSTLWLAQPGVTSLEGDSSPVVCFVAGTMIDTPSGERRVDDLKPGDLVCTRDHGIQELRWIGKRAITHNQLLNQERLYPVRIAAGALGDQMPKEDLYVSRQHRMLVRSKIAERMFGEIEVLVPAIKLLGLDGVTLDTSCKSVTYYHFLCDDHEIVRANGAWSESLHTGPQALKTLSNEARDEIFMIFPELQAQSDMRPTARVLADGHPARRLAKRHQKNQRPLVSA